MTAALYIYIYENMQVSNIGLRWSFRGDKHYPSLYFYQLPGSLLVAGRHLATFWSIDISGVSKNH